MSNGTYYIEICMCVISNSFSQVVLKWSWRMPSLLSNIHQNLNWEANERYSFNFNWWWHPPPLSIVYLKPLVVIPLTNISSIWSWSYLHTIVPSHLSIFSLCRSSADQGTLVLQNRFFFLIPYFFSTSKKYSSRYEITTKIRHQWAHFSTGVRSTGAYHSTGVCSTGVPTKKW